MNDEDWVVDLRVPGDRTLSEFETLIPKVKKELEQRVSKFVTTTKAKYLIEFKGEVRYERKDTPDSIHQAILALQFVYGLEWARAAKEVDWAIQCAMLSNSCWNSFRHLDRVGVDSESLLDAFERYKTARRTSRLGKSKLAKVPDLILERAFASHQGKKDWLSCATADIASYLRQPVCSKIVSRELRKRGIKK